MQRLDDEFCSTIKELLLKSSKFNPAIGKTQPEAIKNIRIAGSVAEGSAIARLFRRNESFRDHLNREIEADYESILFEIPENLKNHVEDLQGSKTGFLNLRLDWNLIKSAINLGWKVKNDRLQLALYQVAPNGYLLPFRLKEAYLEKLGFNDSDDLIETAFAYALNRKSQDISFTNINQDIKKSSVKLEGTLNIDNMPYLTLSFDMVQLIRLKWWPDAASEWKTRKRNWPEKENVINELTKESFIIAKPTHDEILNYDTNELRYSFSHVERKLVEMRSRYQNMIYLIFKCMIYKWLSSINKEQDEIKSFLGKTVMLWVCEANNKEDKTFWKEDFHSMLDVLRHLFREMLKYFEAGFMPYYFIPKINVIESVSVATQNKVIHKIRVILQNIEYHLPSLTEIEGWSSEMIAITKSLLKLTLDVSHQNLIPIFRHDPNTAVEKVNCLVNRVCSKEPFKKSDKCVSRRARKL